MNLEKPKILNDSDEFTTWDGRAVAGEPPHGASIIVYRKASGGHEFLILHWGQQGPDFSGDWAWTPPSGARYPRESIDDCAGRELREETGLSLRMSRTDRGQAEWAIYIAECPMSKRGCLSKKHDRFEWLPAVDAAARCQPQMVGDSISAAAQELESLETSFPK